MPSWAIAASVTVALGGFILTVIGSLLWLGARFSHMETMLETHAAALEAHSNRFLQNESRLIAVAEKLETGQNSLNGTLQRLIGRHEAEQQLTWDGNERRKR
jgi:hypothetical protein